MKALSTMVVFFLTLVSIIGQSYTSYFTGSEIDKSVQSLEFSLTVMGGGTEVDFAMKMFLEDAKGGDVVVLRTSGSDGYNDYLYSELGVEVNSVETIVCHNQNASYDPYVLERILKAEAVWFAGGDQWNYLSYWRGTPLQQYLNFAILDRGMPVGGTSAGMAIMGQYQFTAENGTITSDQALANPYNDRITIDNRPFLIMPLPIPIIFDSHFDDPDRRGRLLTFMARIRKDYGEHVVGIGLDEYTAARIKGLEMSMHNDSWDEVEDFAHLFTYDCNVEPLDFIVEPNTPLSWSGDHVRYRKYKAVPSTVSYVNLSTAWFNIDPEVDSDVNIINGIFEESDFSTFVFPMLCTPVNNSEELDGTDLTISPNPANHALSVEYPGEEIKQISIYSKNGSIIDSYIKDGSEKYNLNISQLSSGVYYMKITTDSKQFLRKFIKI